MTGPRTASRAAVLVSILAVTVLGCGFGRPMATPVVGTTFPPPAPTKLVDPKVVIAGLKKALGPTSPVRLKGTSEVKIDRAPLKVIMDGDFQGNEMDVTVTVRTGANQQLSFDVIGADGKAYLRPYKGKWTKSPEKLPPEDSGPFGDLSKADLSFKGTSKTDRDLYTIVWNDPTEITRGLEGTVWTSIKIKSALMNFEVDINGKPYTATYKVTGTGKAGGKNRSIEVIGYYQFFVIHDPLVFKPPIK